MAIELTSSKKEYEKVELFSIDGKPYFIEKRPRLALALKLTKMIKAGQQEEAVVLLMEELVGEEGYEALLNYEDLDENVLAQIITAAQQEVFGEKEDPKA